MRRDCGRKAVKSVVLKECGVAWGVSLEGFWKLECAIERRKKKSSLSFCIQIQCSSQVVVSKT